MNTPLEDRLRNHYADRTAREALPGPDVEEALPETLRRAEQRAARANGGFGGRRSTLWLATAAAVAATLGVAAVLVAMDDDPSDIGTDDRTSTTTTTTRPEPTSTTTAPTTTTAATTTTTAGQPPSGTGLTVVVDGYGVLGWWDGSAWVDAEPGDPLPVDTGAEYQIVRLDEPITTGVGEAAAACDPAGTPTVAVDVGPPAGGTRLTPEPIAVHGVDDPRPRPVRSLDPDQAALTAAASEALAQAGVQAADPAVVQAVQGDLDGDGVEEVVATTERLAGGDTLYGEEGDYSVIFVGRMVDGSVQQVRIIHQSVFVARPDFTPSIDAWRAAALADLNGDGRMEVVVDSWYYEGSGVRVVELDADLTPTDVLTGGCGV